MYKALSLPVGEKLILGHDLPKKITGLKSGRISMGYMGEIFFFTCLFLLLNMYE